MASELASTNSDESADESRSVSPPDFSSKLCEGVVHDHLSSTCLTASFTASGALPRAKRKVRKVSGWGVSVISSCVNWFWIDFTVKIAETTEGWLVVSGRQFVWLFVSV